MMSSPLTIVVTGAASGIGAALARRLLQGGHRVVAADVNAVALTAKASSDHWDEAHVMVKSLDVRRASDWDRAFTDAESAFGPVDVLYNVAGVLQPGYCHELEEADVDLQIDINVKGVILGTREAARSMVPRGSGHIVNVGSLASLAAVPGLCVYSASKHAVRGFTLAAAEELRSKGVAVSLVMPDAVETPMLTLQESYAEAALTFSGRRPLTAEEVADTLASDVLTHRPLEVTLPWDRGALARAANTFPTVSRFVAPLLERRGKRAQEKRRKG